MTAKTVLFSDSCGRARCARLAHWFGDDRILAPHLASVHEVRADRAGLSIEFTAIFKRASQHHSSAPPDTMGRRLLVWSALAGKSLLVSTILYIK